MNDQDVTEDRQNNITPIISTTEGECFICGTPGVIGMRCSDPDCSGEVVQLEPKAKPAEVEEPERYTEDLMAGNAETVSLEDMAEQETEEKDLEN